ncbi:MAG: cation:proton antiporter [Alphaproteobacteria bacterium]
MDIISIAVVAGLILVFGVVSARLERTVVTAPMVFVLVGLAAGPSGLGWVHGSVAHGVVHALAEVTLILVLFTDASRIDLRRLAREHDIPLRLLLLGLPLTIVLGAGAGMVVLVGFSIWQAAVLAAILAPTDAALGQAVVSNPRVPVRIRQALNVESGLNDGLALPAVLILVSLAGAMTATEARGVADWFQFAAMQIVLGPVVGVVIGYVGGKGVERAWRARWISGAFLRLSAIGLALLSFAGAEIVGGNGFIAAFVAGLGLGNWTRQICGSVYEFGEAEGQLLVLLTFFIFGAFIVPEAAVHVDGRVVLYGLLSLTVVRLIPVAVSLLGKGLGADTVSFLGWFGPRGLASILFALLVVETSGIAETEAINTVVTVTVVLSVFLHGLTAWPFANWYGARAEARAARLPSCPESASVTEMPLRARPRLKDADRSHRRAC